MASRKSLPLINFRTLLSERLFPAYGWNTVSPLRFGQVRQLSLLRGHGIYKNIDLGHLKAGAFRSIAAAYSVKKLHPNSHLYTSETQIEGFPGRTFRIINRCSLNKKEIKENLSDLKKANITVRNFPATVAELRKRIKLAEGGDTYLFASTLNDGQKILIRCGKV